MYTQGGPNVIRQIPCLRSSVDMQRQLYIVQSLVVRSWHVASQSPQRALDIEASSAALRFETTLTSQHQLEPLSDT